MSIRRSFRHVLGAQKPAKPNPWRKCMQCLRRTPPDAVCPVCSCCSGCCRKCDQCQACPLACRGHKEDQ